MDDLLAEMKVVVLDIAKVEMKVADWAVQKELMRAQRMAAKLVALKVEQLGFPKVGTMAEKTAEKKVDH